MDFGGDSIPLVNVQGAHNFFDRSSDNRFSADSNRNWVAFCRAFADDYRVYAPLNRGFGRSDPPLEESSIQSSVEDLLSWMDHLGIKRAFFFGKGPAAQSMLHLAENHPDRVLGLVCVQPITVFTDVSDPQVAEFKQRINQRAYSTPEFKGLRGRMKKPAVYRPRMFHDPGLRVEVPLLYFFHHEYDNQSLWQRRFDQFVQRVERNPEDDWADYAGFAETRSYLQALSKDEQRIRHIRDCFARDNPCPQMQESIRRAFGHRLVLFDESRAKVESWWDMIQKAYVPAMRSFFYLNQPER